jgi:hypothetical protein
MRGIAVTGQPDIDQATAEIAVVLRDAGYGKREQDCYDEASRLRDVIMAGTRALDATVAEPAEPESWGTLCDYDTGKAIRPATHAEWERTARRVHAAASGGTGSYSGEWPASDADDGDSLPADVYVVYVDGGPAIDIDTTSGEPVLRLPVSGEADGS